VCVCVRVCMCVCARVCVYIIFYINMYGIFKSSVMVGSAEEEAKGM